MSLCGWGTVKNGETVYIVAEGGPYWVFVESTNPRHDILVSGPYTPNIDGITVISLTLPGADEMHYQFHSSGYSGVNNADFRVFGEGVTWEAGGPVPFYLSGPSVLTATPGINRVDLAWTADPACDAILDVFYDVARSTTGPSSGFLTIASDLTTLAYADTGLTNGVQYWYRVTAHCEIHNAPTFGTIDSEDSNVATATPAGILTAVLKALCCSTLPIGCLAVMVCQGLTPGVFYTWRVHGVSVATSQADANGRIHLSYSSALAGSDAVLVGASPYTGPLSNTVTITWTSPIGACCVYIGSAPVLSGIANPGSNDLRWTAMTVCDPLLIVHYEVYRKLPSASSFTKIADLISGLTYSDADVAACDIYDYRVKAVASLFAATDTGTLANATSNTVVLTQECVPPSSVDLSHVRFRIGDPSSAPAGTGIDMAAVRFRIGQPGDAPASLPAGSISLDDVRFRAGES